MSARSAGTMSHNITIISDNDTKLASLLYTLLETNFDVGVGDFHNDCIRVDIPKGDSIAPFFALLNSLPGLKRACLARAREGTTHFALFKVS